MNMVSFDWRNERRRQRRSARVEEGIGCKGSNDM